LRFLITCEHGGNRIPARYRPLFACHGALLASHRGYDPGALALARDFASADSTLRAFAARFPGTPSAAETVYWRALVRLDPTRDEQPSAEVLREVRTWLDAYIAGGPVQPRYLEATTLRRLASLLDSLRAAAGAPRGALPSATLLRDSIKVRDDSIARLQKELEQTTAELERIRKRLAPRRP